MNCVASFTANKFRSLELLLSNKAMMIRRWGRSEAYEGYEDTIIVAAAA